MLPGLEENNWPKKKKEEERKKEGNRTFTNQHSKYDSAYGSSYESFPSLFWRQFYQRCAPEKESKHVWHHIAANNHRNGNQEPSKDADSQKIVAATENKWNGKPYCSLEDILNDEEGLAHN